MCCKVEIYLKEVDQKGQNFKLIPNLWVLTLFLLPDLL